MTSVSELKAVLEVLDGIRSPSELKPFKDFIRKYEYPDIYTLRASVQAEIVEEALHTAALVKEQRRQRGS